MPPPCHTKSLSVTRRPHYLLQDYGLRHGDVVYAVIARR
eukprot:COSAG04_NODE_2172_length_4633_cov_2.631451_3_plen_39_part_00